LGESYSIAKPVQIVSLLNVNMLYSHWSIIYAGRLLLYKQKNKGCDNFQLGYNLNSYFQNYRNGGNIDEFC
jgi:hypothetical protein